MPTLADVIGGPKPDPYKVGAFEVAVVSPFTVYLDGSTTAVPGWTVAGLSYSVGTTGMYLLRQGQLPLCIPTA